MIFKDGVRKAGFFEDNVYKRPLLTHDESEAAVAGAKKVPEAFRQEVKEYLGLLAPSDDHSKFIGQVFNPEPEDQMAYNQFDNM